jgi:serine/threonine protein kinase
MNALPSRLAAALAERYRVERELGAGGMATVYLAEDLPAVVTSVAAQASVVAPSIVEVVECILSSP